MISHNFSILYRNDASLIVLYIKQFPNNKNSGGHRSLYEVKEDRLWAPREKETEKNVEKKVFT
jgi:hypothetical protein